MSAGFPASHCSKAVDLMEPPFEPRPIADRNDSLTQEA
jgi:hypothetical protein